VFNTALDATLNVTYTTRFRRNIWRVKNTRKKSDGWLGARDGVVNLPVQQNQKKKGKRRRAHAVNDRPKNKWNSDRTGETVMSHQQSTKPVL
jgi:hypothetical protein